MLSSTPSLSRSGIIVFNPSSIASIIGSRLWPGEVYVTWPLPSITTLWGIELPKIELKESLSSSKIGKLNPKVVAHSSHVYGAPQLFPAEIIITF